jgi:hypothetical protein
MNKPATPPLPASLAGFSPMELNRRFPVSEAAEFNGFKDKESFEKNYPHLVKKVGKRKKHVTLYDMLVLPPPPPGWKPEKALKK